MQREHLPFVRLTLSWIVHGVLIWFRLAVQPRAIFVRKKPSGKEIVFSHKDWGGVGARAPSSAFPPATTPPNQQLFPFIRVQRAAGGGVSAERGGGRARPSPSPLLGSIADKFLFSSHCMSELGGDKEPRGEGRAPPTPFHSVHPPPSTATAYG